MTRGRAVYVCSSSRGKVDADVATAASKPAGHVLPVVAQRGAVGHARRSGCRGCAVVALGAVRDHLRILDLVGRNNRVNVGQDVTVTHVNHVDEGGQVERASVINPLHAADEAGSVADHFRAAELALVGMADGTHSGVLTRTAVAGERINTAGAMELELVVAGHAGRDLDDVARVRSGGRSAVGIDLEIIDDVDRGLHVGSGSNGNAVRGIGTRAARGTGNLHSDAIGRRPVLGEAQVVKIGLLVGGRIRSRRRIGGNLGDVTPEGVFVGTGTAGNGFEQAGAVSCRAGQRRRRLIAGRRHAHPGSGARHRRDDIADPAAGAAVAAGDKLGDRKRDIAIGPHRIADRSCRPVVLQAGDAIAGAVLDRKRDSRRTVDGDPGYDTVVGTDRKILEVRGAQRGYAGSTARSTRSAGRSDDRGAGGAVTATTATATRNGSRYHRHEAEVAEFHKRMFHFLSSL